MKFKLIADTNAGLRDNNEDNFVVSPDLHDGKWTIPVDASIIHEAKDKGVLLVVADGMGGQNAGEVASEIAISTMQELFSPQCITDTILRSEASIKSYLKQCIVEADKRIKRRSQIDSKTAGMGSTIVIAWIIKHTAYIAWLGDSRAYSIIPDKGVIGRISKDHSYVQQLVDKGKITEKAAMTHPDSNIITRSLGDLNSTAKPDIVAHPLEKGEIILLCSDGLCGSVEDEVIGAIIKDSNGDLLKCKQDLISIALKCGSRDNITIALFQVVDSAPAQRQVSYLKRYLIYIIGIVAIIAAIKLSDIHLTFGQKVSNPDTLELAKYKLELAKYKKAVDSLDKVVKNLKKEITIWKKAAEEPASSTPKANNATGSSDFANHSQDSSKDSVQNEKAAQSSITDANGKSIITQAQ